MAVRVSVRGAEGMIEICFSDVPPGVNGLYVNRKRGRGYGRILSKKAKLWREDAGWELKQQRPGHVTGQVNVEIAIADKVRSDLDGHAKCLIDLLVTHGVIEEDNRTIVRDLHMYWDSSISGCRVRVEKVG